MGTCCLQTGNPAHLPAWQLEPYRLRTVKGLSHCYLPLNHSCGACQCQLTITA